MARGAWSTPMIGLPVASTVTSMSASNSGAGRGLPTARAARELQQQSTTTIGLVLADLANPFFVPLADRVVCGPAHAGSTPCFSPNQEDPHLEGESLDTLLGRSVGSVIATPTGGNVDKCAGSSPSASTSCS